MIHHKYKILICRWGISIDLFGDICNYSSYTNAVADNTRCFDVDDSVHILFAPQKLPDYKYINIHPDDYIFIVKGIKNVLGSIKKYSPFNNTLIIFNEAIYNECFFQEEGLIVTSMEWASKAFGFECPKVAVSFDKNNNRYIFDFMTDK